MAKLQANKEYADYMRTKSEADYGVIRVSTELWKTLADIIGNSVEVVRGRWIKRQFADEPTAFGYRCSECHLTYEVDTNYCPNCGADMRGDKNG